MTNLTTLKFRTDLVLFTLFLFLCMHRLTGDALHEWLGVLLLVPLILHLCLNWNWLVGALKHLFGKQSAAVRLNVVWDTLLYLVLAVVVLSGILISRDFLTRFGITIENDPFMSYTHKKLTTFLFVMIGVHLGLHWSWIRDRLTRRVPGTTSNTATTEKEEEVS